jgi:hypothetical protein
VVLIVKAQEYVETCRFKTEFRSTYWHAPNVAAKSCSQTVCRVTNTILPYRMLGVRGGGGALSMQTALPSLDGFQGVWRVVAELVAPVSHTFERESWAIPAAWD